MSSPVDCAPCKPLPPVQAPEAVQEVAWVEDQFSVVLALLLIELCRAEISMKRSWVAPLVQKVGGLTLPLTCPDIREPAL